MKKPFPLLALTLLVGALVGMVPLHSEAPKAEEAKKLTGAEIADKLESRYSFPTLDDPKTTLRDALDLISKRVDIPIEINLPAFANADLPEAEKYELIKDKPLPAMKVSLNRMLRKVLDRLPTKGLVVIRDDAIELTTPTAFSFEIGRSGTDGPEAGGTPSVPLVYAVLERRPLEQALRSLADRTGFSILLDARAGDKAKTPVTATLKNVPLDTAVRLLADMSDLRLGPDRQHPLRHLAGKRRSADHRTEPPATGSLQSGRPWAGWCRTAPSQSPQHGEAGCCTASHSEWNVKDP